MTARHNHLPFVIFQVRETLYAISARNVREIVIMPPVIAVPQAPPTVRGVINLRGKVIKLIDLRIKLGFAALSEELATLNQMLIEREQDHRNWLSELETAVREHRPFSLARDPHQCKFGQWYDHFTTHNNELQMILRGMDAPHQAIHATANLVLQRAEGGDVPGALAEIENRRSHELAGLARQFAELRRVLAESRREIAIVLSQGSKCVAFSTDQIESAEQIPETNIEPMPDSLAALRPNLACRIGQRAKTRETVMIFDDEFFFQDVA